MSRALITRRCALFSTLTILVLGDGADVLEVPGNLFPLTREITPEQTLQDPNGQAAIFD